MSNVRFLPVTHNVTMTDYQVELTKAMLTSHLAGLQHQLKACEDEPESLRLVEDIVKAIQLREQLKKAQAS